MISDNKFSKYLLYALGEIILVVFGILIALQINNWNEQRNLQKKITSIYAIVKSDLQLDIKNIDHVLAIMSPEDSVLKRIMEGDMTREDYSLFNTEIAADMEEIEIDYTDNFAYWKTNKSWFPDNLNNIKNKEFVEYALTSWDYQNRVASWRRLYFNNYLGHLKEYKESALKIISDLDNRTK